MPDPQDYFALLGMPRRAVLDAEELKRRYHELSRETHPDVQASSESVTADSAEINAAYGCLLQPSTRLRHLLLLVAPDESRQLKGGQIPGAFIDIFSSLAAAVQLADGVIAQKKAATSALARALLAGGEMQAREALEAAGLRVAEERASLESESLPAIDADLSANSDNPTAVAPKIAEAFRAFGFLDKWQAQVRGKLLELFESGG
ncbi:MAG: DnaJ domain-containing protein [Verrucomicrobiae bacterium]|nr:DnaJ domain-containing protein [Verrucomicrobiae bacterium]